MNGNGLRSFAFHRHDQADTADSLRPFVGVDTHPPPGQPPLAGLDAEAAARRYLDQAFASEELPSFVQPELQGEPFEFTSLGAEHIPLTDSKIVKFRQVYRRIPVYGSLVTVEMEQDNSLLSLSSSMGEPPESLDPVATLSPKQALEVIRQHAGLRPDESLRVIPRLYFYFDDPHQIWHLAYIAENVPARAAPNESFRAPKVMDYVVDAHSGQLLAELPRTQSVEGPQPPASEAQEQTSRWMEAQQRAIEKALDALGRLREFSARRVGDTLQLVDEELNIHTYDFAFRDLEQDERFLPGDYVMRPPEPWAASAVSAHANALSVALFLRQVLKREGLDNRRGPLISSVNCRYNSGNSREWHNAAWIGTQMVYGQRQVGDTLRTYAVALDVVAHEVLHGLTDKTARLRYAGMSGALNESYSDIFGIIVSNLENPDVGTWNWQMGEELSDTGVPIRDLSQPSRYNQPEHMNAYQNLPITPGMDWGGVHINSGIHNKAAYHLLTARAPDGGSIFTPTEVASLFYIALTQYLSRTSNFSDSRRGVELAARTLFRGDRDLQKKLDAIAAAFDAVGITSAVSPRAEIPLS